MNVEASDKSRLVRKLEELFGIDLRSLALFRVGLGLIIVLDLITRAVDLKAFYTDAGVLPRVALLENASYFWPTSIHLLNGSLFFQAFLFLLTGLFALALAFGYRTRLAAFGCWLLMVSLHARNPFINQAGDTLLHLYLFWGLFLPMGARFSIDRGSKDPDPAIPTRILSGGSVGLLLQVCFVYWFAAINKTGSLWNDGSALYFVFNLDAMAKSPGISLLGYPRILKFLTHSTLGLERWGPFLAFVPVATGFFRCLVVFLFVGFHLGMVFTLKLGSFPYICILGWAVFLPSAFWEYLSKAFPSWNFNFRPLSRGPLQIRSHWVTNVLALLAISYILLVNLAFTSIDKFRPVFFQKYRWVGKLLNIDQSWAMFAPDPLVENWWYVIPGKLRDGSEIELYAEKTPLSWEKPKRIPDTISNVKWRKFFNWMPKTRNAAFRPYYAQYLCREWNARAPVGRELVSLQIYYLHETLLPDFKRSAPQKDLLWEQDCALKPMP